MAKQTKPCREKNRVKCNIYIFKNSAVYINVIPPPTNFFFEMSLQVKAAGVIAQNQTARTSFAVFQIFNPINYVVFIIFFALLIWKYPTMMGIPVSLPGNQSTDGFGEKFIHSFLYALLFYIVVIYIFYAFVAKSFAIGSQYIP